MHKQLIENGDTVPFGTLVRRAIMDVDAIELAYRQRVEAVIANPRNTALALCNTGDSVRSFARATEFTRSLRCVT